MKDRNKRRGAAHRAALEARLAARRMKQSALLKRVKKMKSYALFISMMLGFALLKVLPDMRWLTCQLGYCPQEPVDITTWTKYTLFAMLFITYCKVSPRDMHYEGMHPRLAATQWLGCWAAYLLLLPLSQTIACGVFVCMLMSTATSAPVITGMLGGSVPRLATYCIGTNLALAVVAPVYLSIIGVGGDSLGAGFWTCLTTIGQKVIPLALGPFVLAMIVKALKPDIHQYFMQHQGISFWLWCISLVLIMARTGANALMIDTSEIGTAAGVALGALAACLLQFAVGSRIGRSCGDIVAGRQALGQKNTILGIWLAQTFFDPHFLIVSIAPASYVLWQNLVNSYEIWKFSKGKE